MTPAELLLSRLDGVRQTGAGKWRARCPGHQSKGLTLAIKERDDGALLVHCFAECSVEEVVSAVGLSATDLFPPRPSGDYAKGERHPFNAGDVLACVAEEVRIAWLISRDVQAGKQVPPDDFERLAVANRRVGTALEMVTHGR